jgi:hypothetical protein
VVARPANIIQYFPDPTDIKAEIETAIMAIFVYKENTKSDIPRNVTHVKVDPSVKEIHAWAFADCQSLVEVEFSEGLERIHCRAFMSCENLKFIHKLLSTLKEVGDDAFWICKVWIPLIFLRDYK